MWISIAPGPRRGYVWPLCVAIVALLIAVPMMVVFASAFHSDGEVWSHLYATVLGDYIFNSLLLLVGVAAGTLGMGTACAWLVAMCQFPGRRLFEWALLLPMAMPAYIVAYTYTGLLDFAGPVQAALRAAFGWSYGDYWFPEIRSLHGAVAVLSLVLYPYVYLLARAAFLEQSVCALEVSRTLGAGPWRGFVSVAMPLARPAIVTGLSLALMETLADYGTVQYFGVDTFTTGIFRTWFGLGDLTAATRLAALLLGFVLVLMVLERWSRRQARYHPTGSRHPFPKPYMLRGARAWLASLACLLPLLFGFLVPAMQLTAWAWRTAPHMLDASFLELSVNSFLLAAGASLMLLMLALFLAYGRRLHRSPLVDGAVRLAGLGYAVPGTVIAVGAVLPFAWLDNQIGTWLMLSGTLIVLVFAYAVRFLAVSLHAVEGGLGRIKPSMDDAARSLGLSPVRVLREIHAPLMRGTVLTALLLVFVDVLKELPATLILRPFNFNTLAVRTYELASDERLAEASTAALAIVLAGIVPVILLSKAIGRARSGANDET